jgi:phenylacetate-CoA ligase
MIDTARATSTAKAFDAFLSGGRPSRDDVLELFQRVAVTVPAYRKFLAERGIDPATVRTMDDFRRLPLMDKESYHSRYPLPDRCRNGKLDNNDLVSVSSGSTGTPTMWPRSFRDELVSARRFEQVLGAGFGLENASTLAVVCFPLGTWVGGLFTTACVRYLSAKGYPVTRWRPVTIRTRSCASFPGWHRTSIRSSCLATRRS